MPRGTYLSNPSTAADGLLSTGGGALNMWQGVTPGYNTQLQQTNNGYLLQQQNPFEQYRYRDNTPHTPGIVPYNRNNYVYPSSGHVAAGLPSAVLPQNPNRYVSPFGEQAQSTANAQYGGSIFGAGGNQIIPANVANQNGALDGMTPQEVATFMQQAGYSQNYISGLGQVWQKTGVAQQSGAGSPSGGGVYGERPEWVDGAALEPGESVVDARGNRYVGGTPTEDGTAQYAINYANPTAARDTKGKYKWVSEVRKDQNGNWVRINRQVLRKVYTRSHLKNQASKRYDQRTAGGAGGGEDAGSLREYNQLVNFRAQYG